MARRRSSGDRLGLASAAKSFAAPYSKAIIESAQRLGPEGYSIRTFDDRHAPTVTISGRDPRGVLFGIGQLLRELRMTPGKIELADHLDIATTPRYPLRGHQLAYRPRRTPTMLWDLPQWEQYYRDSIVFWH